MISHSLTEKIQAFINNVLKQDEQTFISIRELSGKVIKIEITSPDTAIFLLFDKQGIIMKAEHDAKPNVTIKARPSAFMGQLLNRDDKVTTFSPEMEIIGDTGLAQRFQQIIRNLEIDWEEHLSHWFGDTTAHKLVRILTQTSELLKETHRTISMDISEYLRYEKDMLPDREEVEEYIAAVDVLRNDVERLQLRIARLQKIITGKVQLHG